MAESPKPEPERFEVILRALANWDQDGASRLKAFLKIALRRFGLKAVSIRPLLSEKKEDKRGDETEGPARGGDSAPASDPG